MGEIRAKIIENCHFVPLIPFDSASHGPFSANALEERFLNVI